MPPMTLWKLESPARLSALMTVLETRVEQRGAVAAVEHESLAAAHPLHDLPAARPPRHHALTGTPSSSLARTTASVESLA